MNKYKIKISRRAEKFILKQPQRQQARILEAIYALPYSGDIKAMAGGNSNEFRLRVGDYRIVYEKDDDMLLIQVIHAGNRGDIYKK